MTAKYKIVSIIILCSVAYLTYAKTTPTKGSSMIHPKQGEKLDLSTFKSDPSDHTLKYIILAEGTGKKLSELGSAGKIVKVDYTGWLLQADILGTKFDSSVDRGMPFEFKLGMRHVITGWDYSVADMKIGETRLVIIPANLGYGARGAGSIIPPNATLAFEISLYSVK